VKPLLLRWLCSTSVSRLPHSSCGVGTCQLDYATALIFEIHSSTTNNLFDSTSSIVETSKIYRRRAFKVTPSLSVSLARMKTPTIASLLALSSVIVAWDYPVQVNLAWPSINHQEYVTLNGQWTGGHSQNDPAIPCANVVIPANQARSPFPTTGGRLQFNTINDTGTLPGSEYTITPYFGQISGGGSLQGAPINAWVFTDFSTSSDCLPDSGPGINATSLISQAIASAPGVDVDSSPVPSLNIVGMNATIGIRLGLFDNNDNKIEEMWQCAYITFVSPDSLAASGGGGICNRGIVHPSVVTAGVGPVMTTAAVDPSVTTAAIGISATPSVTIISMHVPNTGEYHHSTAKAMPSRFKDLIN
jgi:hypothetical protein